MDGGRQTSPLEIHERVPLILNHFFMKNIFFIHWNEKELQEKIRPLKKAGYKVDYHFNTETVADLREDLPDLLVICLDRLPSHGKRYGEWIWEAKKRKHIPVIFCGGTPEKVTPIKLKLPNAIFCSNEELESTIEKTLIIKYSQS